MMTQFTLYDVEPDLYCSGNLCGNLSFDAVILYRSEDDDWDVYEWRYSNGKELDHRAGPFEAILHGLLTDYAATEASFRERVRRHLPHFDANAEHRIGAFETLGIGGGR